MRATTRSEDGMTGASPSGADLDRLRARPLAQDVVDSAARRSHRVRVRLHLDVWFLW